MSDSRKVNSGSVGLSNRLSCQRPGAGSPLVLLPQKLFSSAAAKPVCASVSYTHLTLPTNREV